MTDAEHGDGESDAVVIARSLVDPEIFGLLFTRHGSHIHRYLARRLGAQIADDSLAETFVAAFRRRRSFDLSYPDARPWLYGIASNVIRQHLRAESARLRLLGVLHPDADDPGHADAVADRVSAHATRGPLVEAISGLAPRDREVLLLIAWEDLTYDQVAIALGVPVGTVRSRLHRARRLVRSALGGQDSTGLSELSIVEVTR